MFLEVFMFLVEERPTLDGNDRWIVPESNLSKSHQTLFGCHTLGTWQELLLTSLRFKQITDTDKTCSCASTVSIFGLFFYAVATQLLGIGGTAGGIQP